MKFIKENSGTNTFLTYEVPADRELDRMCLSTLSNNKIPGYLPVSFTQMDDTMFVRYNITSKISVDELFQGPVSKKKMLSVLRGVVNALMASDEYIFLEQSSIVLDSQYIFMDVASCETFVVCLPLEDEEAGEVNARAFLKGLLTEPTPEEGDDQYITTLLRHMNKSPKLSLPEFRELLEQLSITQPVAKTVTGDAPAVTTKPSDAVAAKPVEEKPAASGDGQNRNGVFGTQTKPVKGVDNKKISDGFGPGKFGWKDNKKEAPEEEGKKGFMGLFGGKKEGKDSAASKPQKKPEAPKGPTKIGGNVPAGMSSVNGHKVNIPRKPGTGNAPIPQMENKPKVASNVIGNQPIVGGQRSVTEKVPQKREEHAPLLPSDGGDFPGTVVLEPEKEGTTLLEKHTPYLVYLRTKENIQVRGPVFRIGKEHTQVDYTIVGNSAVSRSHAKITIRGSEYLLEDTNSKNFTYVNGMKLTSGVPVRIKNGDKLTFANEEFEFIIT